MSDPEYQSTKLWFMPASKALDVAEAPPPPGKITITHEFPITRSVMFFSWGPASLHPRHSQHRLCESMQTHCAETLEQLFFLNYASDLLFHSQNFQSSSCKGLDVSISCGLGQFPFNMARAADCIDDLANNVIGRYPVLDVSMSDSQVCSSTCISMCPNHFIFWPAQVCSNNVPGSRAWDSVAASCART